MQSNNMNDSLPQRITSNPEMGYDVVGSRVGKLSSQAQKIPKAKINQ
ncbi:MAG: hypothetical protein NTX45_28100 [Proteobacteria bacterium]|nr:hypothetical protein [Pseudomonadota bacterium]